VPADATTPALPRCTRIALRLSDEDRQKNVDRRFVSQPIDAHIMPPIYAQNVIYMLSEAITPARFHSLEH